MTTLFTLPKQVPVNSSGTPYPGAKLYFYAAGTTTAQPVYSNVSLTTAHAQPVVADAYGNFAPIYLNPNAAANYRVKLYTLGNVLIYDVDNYPKSGISQTAVAQALWPRTAAEIAAGVTPTNYAYEPGNVLRYGTNTSPGTTDMTAAINAAISVAVVNGGGRVNIPAGVYVVSGAGIVLPTGVWLIGDGASSYGAGTKIIPASAAVTRMIGVTGFDCGVEKIMLEGEATNAVIGIDIGHAATSGTDIPGRVTIRNVFAKDCKWAFRTINAPFLIRWESCTAWDGVKGWYFDNTGAILARGVNIAELENCHSVSNSEHGLYAGPSYSIGIENCGFDDDAIGVYAVDVTGLRIAGCTSDNTTTASFSILGCTFDVYGCVFYNSQLPIDVEDGSGVAKGRIAHCYSTVTGGTYSVVAAATANLVLDHNNFDKAVQNDGQRFGHADRIESGFSSVTASGTPSSLTKAITFSRAFSTLRSVVITPLSNYTNNMNTLLSSVSTTGFTANFVRDDAATWSAGQYQEFYWMAVGID